MPTVTGSYLEIVGRKIVFRRYTTIDTKLIMHDSDVWIDKVKTAPDEELLALREANYLGLRDHESEHWRVPIVEDEIRRRGLNVVHSVSHVLRKACISAVEAKLP